MDCLSLTLAVCFAGKCFIFPFLTNTLAISCEELTHWKRSWFWEGLGAGGEGNDRGWDGRTASPTRWTWVWVNSGSWWWTGMPGVLRFMGSQRVWMTERLKWTELVMKGLHLYSVAAGLKIQMIVHTIVWGKVILKIGYILLLQDGYCYSS